eukprot:12906580-Prorocentrum_lima.AAC.1
MANSARDVVPAASLSGLKTKDAIDLQGGPGGRTAVWTRHHWPHWPDSARRSGVNWHQHPEYCQH